MSALAILGAQGFWRRAGAMLLKEFLQLRRDRVSLAMIVMVPLMQLLLFGYAINTTPRDLPTAVLLQETSDVGRSILAALQNTKFFKVTRQLKADPYAFYSETPPKSASIVVNLDRYEWADSGWMVNAPVVLL